MKETIPNGVIALIVFLLTVSFTFDYLHKEHNRKRLNEIKLRSEKVYKILCDTRSKEVIYKKIKTDRLLLLSKNSVVSVSKGSYGSMSMSYTNSDYLLFGLIKKIKYRESREGIVGLYKLTSLKDRETVSKSTSYTSEFGVNIKTIKDDDMRALGILGHVIKVIKLDDKTTVAERVQFIKHSRDIGSSGFVYDYCPNKREKLDVSDFVDTVLCSPTDTCLH